MGRRTFLAPSAESRLAMRPALEPLEPRLLFTTYSLNGIAGFPSNNNGAEPVAGLVADSSGNLFGTASGAGADGLGSVFEVVKNSGTITPLAFFTGTNGSAPEAPLLIDSAGNLFGTTSQGGANGEGVVFEVAHGSATITVLASFNGANGAEPDGGLVTDSNGNLYGTAYQGGSAGEGTIFEIVHGSHTITGLASFNESNGSNPQGNLTRDSAGDLFGTATGGGAYNAGAVFELPAGSSTLSAIASFNASTGGSQPNTGVILDGSGNLFGTTDTDPTGNGTVFEIAHGSNAITTLATFNGTDGSGPFGSLLVDSSGNLYGTTAGGGTYGFGTAFEIANGSSTIATLAIFDDRLDGGTPEGQLVRDSSGNLFGTAYGGGAGGVGTVFEITSGTGVATPLAAFSTSPGAVPISGLVADSAGNLYGVTSSGGSGNGTVFEFNKSTGTVTTIATFSGVDGNDPEGKLAIDSAGDLFGTTVGGGDDGVGTVFEIVKNSGAVTTLASFEISNGANPGSGVVIDSSGNVYGTATSGGSSNDGLLFEVIKNSNAITVLHTFNGSDGVDPLGGLAFDSSGNLYGTTFGSGTSPAGTVFKFAVSSATFSTVGTFNGTNGDEPAAEVYVDASGNIFGTAQAGGDANGDGTVWKIVHGTSTIIDLGNFTLGTTGANPRSGVYVDSSGDIFGTTANGGSASDGTIWEIPAGGSLTVVTAFNQLNGESPQASFYVDSSGNFFGTAAGGAGGAGDLYELPYSTTTIARLFSFGPVNGVNPASGLVEDSSGDLFGTTESGGAFNLGTVFEIAAGSHAVYTLASFNRSNGADPLAGLVMDTSGNLFGTTSAGGANNVGAVFEVVKGSNAITLLASFNTTNGTTPSGALLIDSSGNLYGTATGGGTGSAGVVFKVIKNSGAITDIAAFNTSNGADPIGDLLMDSSGNLFGTTYAGGSGYGTVFKIAAGSSTITDLVKFAGGTLGANPAGGLAIDSSGNLYGTTEAGGTSSDGTIFKVTGTTLTTIASFNASNGADPVGDLTIDSSGNLFGVTATGGANYDGAVFEIAAGSSTITDLTVFSGVNGQQPAAGLLLDSSGNLFGTTFTGGYAYDGTVFELSPITIQVGAFIDSSAPPSVLHINLGPATTTSVTLQADSNPADVDVLAGGTIIGTFPLTSFSSVVIDADSNNDSITINANANLGTKPVTVEGGAGTDTLTILGTTGNDTIAVNAGSVTVNSTSIAFSNIAILKVDPLGGTDSLAVNSGTVEIPANTGSTILTRQFSAITIAAGAKLTIDAPTAHASRAVIVTSTLTMDPAGILDLTGNDLLVHNGNLTTLTQLLTTAYTSDQWTGPGIRSSTAASDPTHLTTLGIANGLTTTFDGQTTTATDVLIKFTYVGDANLSGTVDGSDYTKIDAGFNSHGSLTGWLNGDFNYDGKIDGSDYTLIDNAFNTQTVSLAAQIATPAAEISANISHVATAVFSTQFAAATSLFGNTADDKHHRSIDDVIE